MSHVLTPVLVVAPFVGFALSFVAKYLEDEFQQLLRIVLDSRSPLALIPALIPLQQYESYYKRRVKARFADVCHSKTNLKYYNFFQQCNYYFATIGAKYQKWILFVVTFLKNTALFC